MLAYKFLRSGAVGPFSGFVWPAGEWVTAGDAPAPCRTGIHGCRVEHLPWWLQDELWLAEFDEPVEDVGRKLVTARARLVSRVDAWNAETARRFGEACARRARDRAALALQRAGADGAAAELRACDTPQRVRELARELDVPETARISVLMASDGARRAITGPTATSAYIAAARGPPRRWADRDGGRAALAGRLAGGRARPARARRLTRERASGASGRAGAGRRRRANGLDGDLRVRRQAFDLGDLGGVDHHLLLAGSVQRGARRDRPFRIHSAVRSDGTRNSSARPSPGARPAVTVSGG